METGTYATIIRFDSSIGKIGQVSSISREREKKKEGVEEKSSGKEKEQREREREETLMEHLVDQT